MTPEEARQAEATYRTEWDATHTSAEIAQRDAEIQATKDSQERRKQDPEFMAMLRDKAAELDRKYPKG